MKTDTLKDIFNIEGHKLDHKSGSQKNLQSFWEREDYTACSGILVLGIGNILLRDDGVGVHVVREIQKRFVFDPEIDIIDGGTKGLDLLPLFEKRRRVLIVDAVDFGKEPGYISVLNNRQIPAILHSKLSVHHIGLGEVLLASDMLGIMPEEICLIGIQPGDLNTGVEMSIAVSTKIEELIFLVTDKLRQWNIKCSERTL